MATTPIRSRFGRATFLGIAYGAAVMILLTGFDSPQPVLRATLPLRSGVFVGIGVAVHSRRLRQDHGEQAVFWVGMLLVGLRLSLVGDAPIERIGLTAIAAGSLMLPVALLVAPARRRTSWTGLTVALCLLASAAPILRVLPAAFVALTAYLVFLWAILMALDRHARTADEAWGLALSDALTGLPNRRAIQLQVDRAVEDGNRAAILIADLDRFKALNDLAGHAAGDEALRIVGAALQGAVTGSSVVGRWGGEEFVVLLRGADAADPGATAERARVAVAKASPVTASVGVARLTVDDDASTWLHRADLALYRAKANGRDRVESEPAVT